MSTSAVARLSFGKLVLISAKCFRVGTAEIVDEEKYPFRKLTPIFPLRKCQQKYEEPDLFQGYAVKAV